MKKAIILISVVVLGVFFGCEFLMGPDEPAGQAAGKLNISFGTADSSGNGRAITSGAELPGAVLASLRYDLSLAGPGGETLEQTVSGGENLKLTVALGEWRIQAKAYQGDVLAGSGELTFPVMPGINSVWIPMAINQGYFAVSIQTDNGTIETDVAAAFPGTLITVTATPDTGYALKSGSLSYNDGNDNHPIETDVDGKCTFTMPASDVTISAFFNKSIGFTIQGPQDKMVEVSVVPSDGTISWSGNETATFTVEDSRYTVEDGNLKWMVNGTEITTAAGRSLVIRARDYIRRTYTLTALILENDQWYSREYSFTVVE